MPISIAGTKGKQLRRITRKNHPIALGQLALVVFQMVRMPPLPPSLTASAHPIKPTQKGMNKGSTKKKRTIAWRMIPTMRTPATSRSNKLEADLLAYSRRGGTEKSGRRLWFL